MNRRVDNSTLLIKCRISTIISRKYWQLGKSFKYLNYPLSIYLLVYSNTNDACFNIDEL